MAKIPGLPVAFIAAGGVLVWSGVENEPVTSVLRSLASGQAPAKGPAETFATPAAAAPSSSGNLGSGSGAQIAQDALSYAGHCYGFGGAPGTSGTGCWDCSSFVNWVVGHDMGLAIPFYKAGGYDGSAHGPPTGAWLAWTGCTTVQANGVSQAQAGDIVVGVTHMGIYTSDGDYMSAHDPAEATSNKPVSTFPDPLYLIRRLKAVASASTALGQTLPDVVAHVGVAGG
jgi:cell wall-associated NlpC family hydrolase